MVRAWLREHLACPRDGGGLVRRDDLLRCGDGHAYPVVEEVPVLLVQEAAPTHPAISRSLAAVGARPVGLGALGTACAVAGVDPFVQAEIVATNGLLYRGLRGSLPRYPIPALRLPSGGGRYLLDVGCNW